MARATSQRSDPSWAGYPEGPYVSLSAVGDLAEVGERWQRFQGRVAHSFFQSWTWIGCLAAVRFTDPVLLVAIAGDCLLALGLFNRRRSALGGDTLWLGESGCSSLDAVFVEHNGLLTRGDANSIELLARCLRAGLRAPLASRAWPWGRRIRLSGVDSTHLRAAYASGGTVRLIQTRPSPFVDLASLGTGTNAYLESLSANTRYQLRRSIRKYELSGPLSVSRARTIAEGYGFLDSLGALHQRTWRSRGKPGAFANPAFVRFHRALIERGLPRGEIDLLQMAAGPHVIGYLYNIRYGGLAASYQSGFDYESAQAHQKPGLTCHYLGIEYYRAQGLQRYDFLAGDDQYKTSLAKESTSLHWLDLTPSWSVRGLLDRARANVSLRPATHEKKVPAR